MPERASRGERGATPGRIRRKRAALAAGTGIPVAVLLATLASRPGPLLVWNASPSSPIGLYRVTAAQGADSGDMVIAWPPGPARVLGAERHYLPRNVPLVKRVAAAAGDRVCARGTAITVNGRPVATRRASDPSGRPLPWWWNGCEVLRGSDLLLLSIAAPQAFDGRYFGISRSDLIVGRARLLWPR